MGYSYLTNWITQPSTGRAIRNVGTAIGAASGAYYLGKNIYSSYFKPRYRSKGPRYIYGLGTGNFRYRPSQYHRFISGKRGFRVRQRRGYTRRRYRPRGIYLPGRYQTRGHTYFRYNRPPGTSEWRERNVALPGEGGSFYQRYYGPAYTTGRVGYWKAAYTTREPGNRVYRHPRQWIPSTRQVHPGETRYRKYGVQSRQADTYNHRAHF